MKHFVEGQHTSSSALTLYSEEQKCGDINYNFQTPSHTSENVLDFFFHQN